MIFTISEADFFDKNKVKVFYGVAGRGKSSKVVDYLKANNVPFLWTTSTNKLKRDAIARYGIEASTVCSALFVNDKGRFYLEPKTPEHTTVIIDEILQTDPKVIDWIEQHRGAINIIVLTDTHQMLTQSCNNFVTIFNTFLTQPYVVADEGTTTLRARDQQTKDIIEDLYKAEGSATTEFVKLASTLPIIDYKDMPFNLHDIYICHKNVTEDYLYKDKNLQLLHRKGIKADLIPKGSIANKPPKNETLYPILSQIQAEREKATGYYQVANIGSCTRYQGAECKDTQKLYYIVTPSSVITNREWYTVVSRCWTIKSLVIVLHAETIPTRLQTYRGKKIKDLHTLTISEADYENYQ